MWVTPFKKKRGNSARVKLRRQKAKIVTFP